MTRSAGKQEGLGSCRVERWRQRRQAARRTFIESSSNLSILAAMSLKILVLKTLESFLYSGLVWPYSKYLGFVSAFSLPPM